MVPPKASASTCISSGATAEGKPLNLNVLAEALAIFPASVWTSWNASPSLCRPSTVTWISPLNVGGG